MFLKLYKVLSLIFSFPIFLYFIIRLLTSKEKINSLLEKFSIRQKERPRGKIIWINGVSIGEAKTGIIIAEQIKKKSPNTTVLFSTSTLTAYKLISDLSKNLILVYSPLDISFIVRRFIRHWKPESTIFIESEIWPNIFSCLKKNSVRLTLVNARISKKSYSNWKKLKFFSKELFELIDECYAQDQDSAKRFEALGVKKIRRIGNLKFLSEKLNYNSLNYKKLKKQLKNKRVVTIFSSHEGDEEIFINCQRTLSKKINNLFFIIIPRHIHRTQKIKNDLMRGKKSFLLRTKDKLIIKDREFLVVDTFGELGLFFKLSEIAVVGGSFSNIGGHNPIETNDFNCSVVFGPHMQNFKDVKKKILTYKAGFEVQDSDQLTKRLYENLNNRSLNNKSIRNFRELCRVEYKKSKLILKSLIK